MPYEVDAPGIYGRPVGPTDRVGTGYRTVGPVGAICVLHVELTCNGRATRLNPLFERMTRGERMVQRAHGA